MQKNFPLLIDGVHRLQVWREYRALSGAELGRLSGIKPAFITQIEKGRSQPSLRTLFALLMALNITPAVFFEVDPRKQGPDMELRLPAPVQNLLPSLPPEDREEVEMVLRLAKASFARFIADYANERKNARRRRRRKRARP
jgi:transcriptional regulator with XRE-family HTH domain